MGSRRPREWFFAALLAAPKAPVIAGPASRSVDMGPVVILSAGPGEVTQVCDA
jgi:hypothetical protein